MTDQQNNRGQIGAGRSSRCSIVPITSIVGKGGGGGIFNTGGAVREFEIVEGTVLIFFPLYSHPLQLSEIGCIPPPTPIALPSITPCWQQTDTSSHSCGALNIALLQSAATR